MNENENGNRDGKYKKLQEIAQAYRRAFQDKFASVCFSLESMDHESQQIILHPSVPKHPHGVVLLYYKHRQIKVPVHNIIPNSGIKEPLIILYPQVENFENPYLVGVEHCLDNPDKSFRILALTTNKVHNEAQDLLMADIELPIRWVIKRPPANLFGSWR